MDPMNSGALKFSDFSSKIFAGMTQCKPTGEQLVVPLLFPAKERTENLANHIQDIRR